MKYTAEIVYEYLLIGTFLVSQAYYVRKWTDKVVA